MSRRKQARPIRALKNSKEDEEDGEQQEGEVTEEGDQEAGNPHEYADDLMNARHSSESEASNLDTSGESGQHVAMETIDSAVKLEPTDLSTSYRCEHCSSLFNSLTDLFEHKSTGCFHGIAGSDSAVNDGESRSTSEDVSDKSHMSDGDTSDTGYVAEGCSNTDQQFFLEHRQAAPKDCPRPYPCPFCNKTFSRLSFLNRHEQYHDDKMPFKCKLCERLFKHKRSRDRHMRLHTGDKKFTCSQCGLSFARSDHLKAHHKSPCFKTYTCSRCLQNLPSEADLVEHSHICQGNSPDGKVRLTEMSASQSAPKMYSILTGKEVLLSDMSAPSSSSAVNDESSDLTCIKVSRPKVKPLDHGCPFCASKNFASVESLNAHIQKNHKVNDSNPYTCNLCGKVYPSYYNLVEHISVIHEQDEDADEKTSKRSGSSKDSSFYICGYCTMKFSSMPSLHEHVKRVHAVGGLVSFIEDGKLVCAHCNAGFPSDVALMDHFRNVHGLQNTPHPSKLPCPQCTKTYPNTKILHEHIRRSHSQPLDRMRYPCPYCLKQNLFDSIEQLQLHVEVIHKSEQEPIFLCPHEECKSHFNSDKDLKVHMKQQHSPPLTPSEQQWRESPKPNTPPRSSSGTPGLVNQRSSPHPSIANQDMSADSHIPCPICKKMFVTEDEMYKHSLVHFKDESLEYACKDCGKLFKRPDELQKHLFEIHAHHLYKCSLCKEIFDCKVSIQVHFAVKHSNETKIMGCIKCGMTFPTELDLLKHVKVDHLNILNYHKCLFCSHTFSSEVDLQCHLVTHSQVYKCSVCRIPFGSKDAFQEHLDTVHNAAQESAMETDDHQNSEVGKASKRGSEDGSKPGTKPGTSLTDEDVGQEGCFVCQICDDKFPLKMLLDLHHQSKHNLRARSVTSSPASNSSSQDDHESPKYSCVICSRVFASRQKVLDHVHCHASKAASSSPVLNPSLSPPCVCHFCQRPVKNESDFMWHTQVHQTDISTPSNHVRCVVCLQLLPPSELAVHVQFHLPMPFVRGTCLCYICGKTNLTRSEVTPKVDELGRPYYVCYVCNQRPREDGSDTGSPPTSQSSPLQSKYSVRCHKCNVKFETQAELASHLPTHQNKTYQCIKCQRTFGSEAEIKLHVTSHVLAEGILHECKLCHMVLDSPAKLQCHLIEHTFSSRDYVCPICKAVFASAQDIQGHAIEHGMDARQHLCTQCNQAFFFSAELENHLLSRPHHQESKSFQCGDCSMSCNSLAELSEHMKCHHARPKRYRCSVCDESFTSSDQVQQHYRNHHSIPKEAPAPAPEEYQCFYCDKTFPGVSNLQGHMKIHSDGKKYTCSECNKVFALERNLTVHMRSHNSEKPYQCPICEKRFARKDHRKAHMKSHSGFKSFLCPLCDKKFARKIQLREHMRSHSGQSLRTGLHRCEICFETFTLSKNLRRHKKRVHKVFGSSGSASTSSQSQDEDAEKASSLEDMDVASAEVTSSQDLEANPE